MKVLLSAGMIQGGRSGVGRYVIRIAEGLVARGVDLSIAGLSEDRDLFPQIEGDKWLEIPKTATTGWRNLLWHQRNLPGELKQREIDLVHIPSYRRILWRSPVKQVSTIHDCAPFVLRNKYGLLRGLFGRWLTPLAARRCEQVITVSEYTADHINRFLKVPRERIEVVWNGIDHSLFKTETTGELNRFRQKHEIERPYFVYVSRLEHPGKNHVRLIAAYEKFRRELNEDTSESETPQLVLVGSDWQGSEIIKERARQSDYSDDVRFAGFTPDNDLPLWYGAASAMVMPSLFEGFGLPLVEAMACGCPVIASDIEVFREVAEENALYVDPESEESIAWALGNVFGMSADQRAGLRKQGLERAQSFSWDQATEQILSIYQGTN